MKVVYSPKCLGYLSAGHPESPIRVKLIYEELKKDKIFEFVRPKKANPQDLLLVHLADLIHQVKHNTFLDVDTAYIEGIYDFALEAVSCAITAAEIAVDKGAAFSLSRPPGHHATKNQVGGFCYFNNLAIAVMKLINRVKKVAILDIDAHHGNGTQSIFLGDKRVIFCSLHQTPLYPGTGYQSEKNCYNFPLSLGTNFIKYQMELYKALKIVKNFHSDVLAVSLGFDTYKKDPLASLKLDINDYSTIGKLIRSINKPTVFILEGGYSKDIGKCAASLFSGFLHEKDSL